MSGIVPKACIDARQRNCLFCKEGSCTILSDTKDCTFFKDVRAMSPRELRDYRDEVWKSNYKEPDDDLVKRRQELGSRLREKIDFNKPMGEIFGIVR